MKEVKITTIVKQALAKKYGHKNVQVRRGTGTAYGWVEARIMVDKKAPSCDNCRQVNGYVIDRCYHCSNEYSEIGQEARRIAYSAMKAANKSFYTYTSDDGYGSAHSEFLLQVEYLK